MNQRADVKGRGNRVIAEQRENTNIEFNIIKPATIALIIVSLLALLCFYGCAKNMPVHETFIDSNQDFTNGEEAVSMERESIFLQPSIPPLDQKVPERLETATFALG